MFRKTWLKNQSRLLKSHTDRCRQIKKFGIGNVTMNLIKLWPNIPCCFVARADGLHCEHDLNNRGERFQSYLFSISVCTLQTRSRARVRICLILWCSAISEKQRWHNQGYEKAFIQMAWLFSSITEKSKIWCLFYDLFNRGSRKFRFMLPCQGVQWRYIYHWKTWWCLWSPYCFLEWCLCKSPPMQGQWRARNGWRKHT